MAVGGLDRLKAKLAKFPESVKAATKAANETNADQLVDMMKRLVPVETGALKNAIHKEPGGTETSVRVAVGTLGGGIGSEDDYYARWVEFGTAPHSLEKGASRKRNKKQGQGAQHPGAKAKPFFYPSYRALKKTMKSRTSRAARKAIKDIAAGGSGPISNETPSE